MELLPFMKPISEPANLTCAGGVAQVSGKRFRIFFPHLVMAALAVLLAAAIAGQGCAKNPGDPLRIGINMWPGFEPIYLAQEKGFFREAGVEVRLVEFGSLSESRRAYEGGKLDGMAGTIIEVLMARDVAARDLRIFRIVDFSSGADRIVAGSGIRSMADLRGKRVGLELASLGIYILARALETEGMTLADVKPVSRSQRAMCDALLAGELDAVVTYPPESARVLRDARFREVFSSRQIPGEVVDVLSLDGAILRHRPGQVAAFNKALDRAMDYLKQHPDEACRIMGEREDVPGPEFERLLGEGITLVPPGEQAAYLGGGGKLRPVVDRVARSLLEAKLISGKPGIADCLSAP